MHVKISYDDNFTELMLHLKSKYGQKMFDLDGIGDQLDIDGFSKGFFTNRDAAADNSVDSNSNITTKDMIVYNVELPKPYFRLNAYYLLWKKLRQLYGQGEANKIIEMQLSGDFYINDLHGVSSSYCFNYSTYDIALEGLPMVNKIKSIPPKYLNSFKSQLEQFVTIASNFTLGAAGLADLTIVMSYYIDKLLDTQSDAGFKFASIDDCWKYVKEHLVSFIYTINQPNRSGVQSPFTNVSIFDDEFLKSLAPDYIFPDGKIPRIETIKQLQELFLDVMNEELSRTPVTFPITTACFSVDDDGNIIDKKFLEMVSTKNLKFAFINIYCGKTSVLSSCCRLRSDTTNEYFNSFGAGSSKLGSLGVVSVNLPRIAYNTKNEKDNKSGFLRELERVVERVGRINNAKRHIVKKRIENGHQPLYTLGFMDLNKQYSTCGLNGINEAVSALGMNILEEDGTNFVIEMLQTINKVNDRLQKQYRAPHNCEQVPGENSSIKLAKKDFMLGYETETEFYSNQFIPLIKKADMLDRIRLQGKFDKHLSGGAICHLNVEQQLSDCKKMSDLIESAAKMGVIYFAINYVIQRCKNDHMTVGRDEMCNKCGEKVIDSFTRVAGFLTKISDWAKIRRENDFPNRQFYKGI